MSLIKYLGFNSNQRFLTKGEIDTNKIRHAGKAAIQSGKSRNVLPAFACAQNRIIYVKGRNSYGMRLVDIFGCIMSKKVDFGIFVGRKMGKRTIYAITVSLLLFGMTAIRCQAEETAMTKEDLNIVFAVDHSGSMNEQDAGQMIPKMLQIFTDTMHGENITIGYLAYNDTIVARKTPIAVDQEDQRQALKQTIAETQNRGETDIGLGLKEAYHLMDGCSGKKMVVLISDGETDLAWSNTGRTEEDSRQDIV